MIHFSDIRNRFRWVFCQLELLCQAFPSSVRHILEELPESLDMTYERILKEIGKPNQKHAYRLLQCLVAAVRPLRVKELAEVLAVDFDTGGTPMLNPGWRWSDDQEAVLSACSSLVAIVKNEGQEQNEDKDKDDDSRIVQFSHFSVKEYLMSSRLAEQSKDVSQYHIQLEPAHTILAQACLGVLLRLDNSVDRNSVKSFPLARYAARNWVRHAQFGNVSSRIEDGMDCLFDADKPHFSTWLWIFNKDRFRSLFTERPPKPEAVPLYYAALHGFRDVAERLLAKYPEDINAEGGRRHSPLRASAHGRHYDVFSLLIDHFPTVDIPAGFGSTALHLAAWVGQLEIGQQLLNRGANVNIRDISDWTPLHIAAHWGQFKFARMLLEHWHKAQIDAQTNDGDTPLHHASRYGHVETVELFLEYGANIRIRNNEGRTPSELALSHPELGRLMSALIW